MNNGSIWSKHVVMSSVVLPILCCATTHSLKATLSSIITFLVSNLLYSVFERRSISGMSPAMSKSSVTLAIILETRPFATFLTKIWLAPARRSNRTSDSIYLSNVLAYCRLAFSISDGSLRSFHNKLWKVPSSQSGRT